MKKKKSMKTYFDSLTLLIVLLHFHSFFHMKRFPNSLIMCQELSLAQCLFHVSVSAHPLLPNTVWALCH